MGAEPVTVGQSQVCDTIDLWYAAGFGRRPWGDALRATAALFGGAGAGTFDLDRTTRSIGQYHRDETVTGANDYLARMREIDPRMHYSLAHPQARIVADYQILSEAEIRRHEFYDLVERITGTRYFLGARVLDDGSRSVFTSIVFSRRQGHADEAKAELLRRLAPHMSNAWRVSGLRHDLETTTTLAETLAVTRDCGVIGLNANGTLLSMNAVAESLVARNDGLVVDDGEVRAARAANDRALQKLVGETLNAFNDALNTAGGVITIARPSGRTPFVLRVVPCLGQRLSDSTRLPAVLIFLADPDRQVTPRTDLLLALGLSKAEAGIAELLAGGKTLAEAARSRGVSHNTARAQLRSIFAKLHVRSQVELVSVLCEVTRIEDGIR
jgi:DNA-binding CsgD family transcriptional regulator